MTRPKNFLALFALATFAGNAAAQDYSNVEIKPIKLTENVYMLVGAGGNMGLSVGDDGVFLIDDQFAPLTEKILAAIRQITDKPVKFVVNTHWHFDHTGGNENLGKMGSVIVAHDNVRKRMSTEQVMEAFGRTVPASPPDALPVITFADSVTFHWNDDEIAVQHIAPAHTDGDSIIYFRKANVLHTGDAYFNGMYPFIDASAGGSITGMIAGVERALKLCDDKTQIIPGHGPASNTAEMQSYLAMLKTAESNIRKLIEQGKTRDEIIAAKPTASLDEQWGDGFMKPDVWVGIVYDSMQN